MSKKGVCVKKNGFWIIPLAGWLLLLLVSCGRNTADPAQALLGHWYCEDFDENYYFSPTEMIKISPGAAPFRVSYRIVKSDPAAHLLHIAYAANLDYRDPESDRHLIFHFNDGSTFAKPATKARVEYHNPDRVQQDLTLELRYVDSRTNP